MKIQAWSSCLELLGAAFTIAGAKKSKIRIVRNPIVLRKNRIKIRGLQELYTNYRCKIIIVLKFWDKKFLTGQKFEDYWNHLKCNNKCMIFLLNIVEKRHYFVTGSEQKRRWPNRWANSNLKFMKSFHSKYGIHLPPVTKIVTLASKILIYLVNNSSLPLCK